MCLCNPNCGSSSGTERKPSPHHQIIYPPDLNLAHPSFPPTHHHIIYPSDLNLSHPSLPPLLLAVTCSLETFEAGLGSALHAFLTAVGIRMPDCDVGGAREGKGKERVGGDLVIELRLRWDTGVSFELVILRGREEGDGDVLWVVTVGVEMAVGARGDVRELLIPQRVEGFSWDGEGRRDELRNADAGSERGMKRKRDGDDGGDQDGKRKGQERENENEDEGENSDAEWGIYLCDEEDEEEGNNGDEDEEEDGNGKGRHRDSGVGIRINM